MNNINNGFNRLHILVVLLLGSTLQSYAQTGDVGIGTNTPQAKLHVNGDLRIDTINTAVNPNNVLVLDTASQNVAKISFPITVGDIKQGLQVSDHNGWIKLDGRAITSLSTTQQAAATTLGFTTNLPDATNAFPVQDGNTLGSINGSNSKTISLANLPNVNFTGTAASAGDHNHSVDPAAVSSSSDGNHAHVTDPAAVATTTNGNHSHAIGRRLNTDAVAHDPGDIHAGENSAATTDRAYWGTFNTGGGGDHNHTVDIPATTSTTNGAHTHAVTVSSGGSGTALDITPKRLSVNTFLYLGN